MVMDAVVERFAKQSPITLMARLALQCALEPEWMDRLFDEHRQYQYKGGLLFSSTVELMSVLALGLRPSVHAAFQASPGLPVSVQGVYDKIKRTDPALVRGSGQRL